MSEFQADLVQHCVILSRARSLTIFHSLCFESPTCIHSSTLPIMAWRRGKFFFLPRTFQRTAFARNSLLTVDHASTASSMIEKKQRRET
jgi:hypothetical protein